MRARGRSKRLARIAASLPLHPQPVRLPSPPARHLACLCPPHSPFTPKKVDQSLFFVTTFFGPTNRPIPAHSVPSMPPPRATQVARRPPPPCPSPNRWGRSGARSGARRCAAAPRTLALARPPRPTVPMYTRRASAVGHERAPSRGRAAASNSGRGASAAPLPLPSRAGAPLWAGRRRRRPLPPPSPRRRNAPVDHPF
jgi:hypothetical protein